MLISFLLASAIIATPRIVFEESFPIKDYTFVVTHQPGGRTTKQAEKQLNLNLPETVVFITNGGYFAPDWEPIENVDLVVTKNIERTRYLFEKSRPILAIGRDKISIFTGQNGHAYRKFVKYRSYGRFRYAIAGDSTAINPQEKTNRQIITVKNAVVTIIIAQNADQEFCQVVLDNRHLVEGEYIFFDGGWALEKGAAAPSHFAVMTRSSANQAG